MKLETRTPKQLKLVALGAAIASTVACGAPEGVAVDAEHVGSLRQAVETTPWQDLNLRNGWVARAGNPPRVRKVSGVTTFRGAMTGKNATSTIAFFLPSDFRPEAPDIIDMRIAMGSGKGGTLEYMSSISPTNKHAVHVIEDGVASGTVGAGAKAFTSLDGASFDQKISNSEPIDVGLWGWGTCYGRRTQGGFSEGAFVKKVDGTVRLQGCVATIHATARRLFQLPSQYRPEADVYVPVVVCPGSQGESARLSITRAGDVYVQTESGDLDSAHCMISLEGVSFNVFDITATFPLGAGWYDNPYSTRDARARMWDGVVHLQGGLAGGTTTTIGTLPTWMRPSRTVWMAADSINATRARIRVDPNGTVKVDKPSLSVAKGFTSLEGVSFALD